jgi:hypothetical protein
VVDAMASANDSFEMIQAIADGVRAVELSLN